MNQTRTSAAHKWAVIAIAVAVFAAVIGVLAPTPAAAANYTFLVNSLSHQGDDVTPGDGVCETAAGICTLRAALQESNALPAGETITVAPAEDVDADTAGVQNSGTIVGSGTGTANFMYVGTLTPHGDVGAYFLATRAVTLDFQNRLGIASLNDANGATAIYVNGPGVQVRNFDNIKSNETAFVFGPDSDGSVTENGACEDAGSINLERCFWLADGAASVTVRNVSMGSTYNPVGCCGAILVASGATVDDLTVDRIRMHDPDTEYYTGFDIYGSATLNRLTITGSTFEGFGGSRLPIDLRGGTLNDSRISGNTFTRINNAEATIRLGTPGTGNVIADNVFDNAGSYTSYWAVNSTMAISGTTASGYTIQDNYFDGYDTTNPPLYLATSGILPVLRNTFGPENYGGGGAANETSSNALMYNTSASTNQNINTWYPTALDYDTDACTLDVTVTPPTTAPVPATPVTVDVFYTPTTKAEIYLGSESGLIAESTITVPYSLGAGNIRVQTSAATGASSQYSRVLAQSQDDLCGPSVTIDQATSQADPSSTRDVLFTVQLSETVSADLPASAVSTEGSTAPGVTVTNVSRLSGSSFQVTARADGSGTIVLSLPAGALPDDAGNPSLASTSIDNTVTYVSPLSLAPTSVAVTEGGATQTYTVTSTLAATAPITIAPSVTEPAWATTSPSPLVIDTTATSGEVTVAAVDDAEYNGDRSTAITHVVTSADPNFDGLLIGDVAVAVADNDQPVAASSELTVTSGPVVADGTASHTATATIRNAAGGPVGGVLVTYQVQAGATASAGSCTTAADGTCTVQVTSTTPGTYDVSASVLSAEIAGSPATIEFVAGPPDPGTSTISASALTLPADGVSDSTITVQLKDALGNDVTTGGETVTMATTGGTLSGVTDNGDGTYTATLTAPTTVGSATVSYTVGGTGGEQTVTLNFVAGEPSPSTSTIIADPTSITADGSSTSTITVTLVDGYGNPVISGGADVVVATDLGAVSAVTDNGDGTYTATLTSATTAGTATVSFAVDGAQATATATVELVAGAADPASSTITASPTAITADGVSQSQLTVRLLDSNGNPLTSGDTPVEIVSTTGHAVGPTVNNGDGTYTAVVTAPTTPGTGSFGFEVDGTTSSNTAQVQFLIGEPDPTSSLIAADPTSITADGVSTSTVTVTVRDAQGNILTEGGADVAMSTTAGALSGVSDNGDGTYTATLTSTTIAGSTTISFTVGGVASPQTAVVNFVAGDPDPATSTIAADPTSIIADGVATSTVTVTLLDANGNPLTTGGATVAVATTLGTFGTVTDNGDGTYTAYLTSTQAGTATISFTVDGVPATATATVDFVAGSADPTTSTIAANPSTITADGVATSTITVTLLDANGNPLGASGGEVTMATTAGALSGVTDNGDGTYTATLTSATDAGTATISFTVDGTDADATATVDFVAGAADPATSTIAADPTSITADGTSTSTVTVTLLDANGNPLGASGGVVAMATDLGTLSAVTDNGDGTYTAMLTSATTVGTATISFTLNATPGTATATVDFVAGTADPGTSTIAADPTTITADGTSTSAVTVTLLDANGNPLGAGGDTVSVATDLGTLSAVTDNGDGTYTAILTSATTAGTATISFTVNDTPATATATVDFVAGAADPGTSTITADPTTITADGTSTSAVTVTLLDANGNPLGASGGEVTMSTDLGTLSAVTDNGDGTYTATLTSATEAGTATISFSVNDVAADAAATVDFVAGAADPGTSTITAAPASITADGTSTSTVTVTLRDASGNPLTASGGEVVVATTGGTVSAVTDNGDGTYTATLTSPTTAGSATLSFTVDGVPSPNTTVVTFAPGAASPGTSTIAADPTSITADGTSTSTVTVTLLDANGNPLTTSGGTVVVATTAGTLSATTDNGDGTYTATLTSPTTVGSATLSFTVDGVPSPNTAAVDFVAGPADPGTAQLTADPTSIVADGTSTSTITLTLLDANGNPVSEAGHPVTMSTDAGTLSAVTDNGDGTYTATLTSPTTTTPPAATITFTLDGIGGTDTATVSFVPGEPSAETSEIAADPTSITADGTSTSTVTVTLRDGEGNLVTDAGDVVAMSTDASTLTDVADNGDGTYTATLTSATTAGTATVSFTVNGAGATATAQVDFTPGPPAAGTSTITATPSSIVADGATTSQVTVTLLDANGNRVTTGGAAVTMSTTAGMLSDVTDNGDGTYTATLTSATTAGTATISFIVDGTTAPVTAMVDFTVGPADPESSTITAAPTTIESDGTDASTITVQLVDANGNPITSGGATVAITSSLGTISAVTDNGDGTYTATLTSTTPGTATVSFSVTGATSPNTATVTAEDTVAPAAPVITSPTDGARVRPETPISGAGEPGATVTVTDQDGGEVCTTTVNTGGAWTCVPTSPLPEGETTLTAIQNDAAGNDSAPSAPVTVTVDDTPPDPPVLDPTNGTEVTGSAEPGATVTIYDSGSNVVCATTADADGQFVCLPPERIPEGTLLSATATDEAGNVSQPSFVRVGGPSLVLEIYLAEPGDTQVAYGRGFLPGESVDGLLESTPIDLGTQTADPTGAATFTIVLPADIDAGTHRITLTGEASGDVADEFDVVRPAPGTGSQPTPDQYTPPTPSPDGTARRPGPSALAPTGAAKLPALVGSALVLILVGWILARRHRRPAPTAGQQSHG